MRSRTKVLILLVLLIILSSLLVSCHKQTEFRVILYIDGEFYDSISLSIDETISIPAVPEKEGYTLDGWYSDETLENKYTNTTMPAEDVIIYAKWQANQYTITFNTNEGSEISSITQDYDTTITAPDDPTKTGYTFEGWYSDTELTKAFIFARMPAKDNTIYAKWLQYTRDLNYIWFGEYPQTIASDSAVTSMGTVADTDGYYISTYDNERYAKITANPYNDPSGSDYKFSNGTWVTGGQIYYFKVEPIKWRILSENSGEALMICESIIANKRYNEEYYGTKDGVYANNYEFSEIREWLINEFYNTAFSELQRSMILINYRNISTEDKIFLPKYEEIVNVNYGFNSDTTRMRQTNDYTRATGAYMNTNTKYYGNGWWWLRSPYYNDYLSSESMTSFGWRNYNNVEDTSYGVVPILKIKLSKINQHTISFNTNAGYDRASITQGYGTTVKAPSNPTKTGYSFVGWYSDSSFTTEYVFSTMPAEDITVFAKWLANEGMVSFNNNGGTGTMESISMSHGDSIPANTFSRESYTFVGWSLESEGDVEYTDEESIRIITDQSEITLYAFWRPQNTYNTYMRDGSYIWFGEYPQTIASSSAVSNMGTVADSDGYYTSTYDNARYAKVTATTHYTNSIFSNNATVIGGEVYYFKVEPIKWRILSESNGEALILCESIIAKKRYDDSSNNYMESEIRAWLNNEFYNTAFSELQKAIIIITQVNNSAYSTGRNSNTYTCANTNDKIFLPSYSEMVNADYGFNNDENDSDIQREMFINDYNIASEGSYAWWLRSPHYNYSDKVLRMGGTGAVLDIFYNSDGVDTNCGVVPALKIRLS